MHTKKTIVLANDDLLALTEIVSQLEESVDCNLITVQKTVDLLKIIDLVQPDLLILNIRNSPLIIHLINQFIDIINQPILCLLDEKQIESRDLKWKKSGAIFTLPLEFASHTNLLGSNIRSIFSLLDSREEYSKALLTNQQLEENNSDVLSNKNICKYLLELDKKNKTLQELKDEIKKISYTADSNTKRNLASALTTINHSLTFDSPYWDDFKVYFEAVNPKFINWLSLNHPSLSNKDLKYCCYLKMNMSNDDIRNLLGINQESVSTHKYRLKKKIGLTKNHDLRSYLFSITNN
jgi:DNA-binding CsgD family transcriptional regulator